VVACWKNKTKKVKTKKGDDEPRRRYLDGRKLTDGKWTVEGIRW
jgi:hypothetical protein